MGEEDLNECVCPLCGGMIKVSEFTYGEKTVKTAVSCLECNSRFDLPNDGWSRMRGFSKRLMPEGMEWPTWPGGKKIEIGDVFESYSGKHYVQGVLVKQNTALAVYEEDNYAPEVCVYIKPDSQERIDEDANKNWCDYWGQKGPCNLCPRHVKESKHTTRCITDMMRDLLRRQRELQRKNMMVCNGQD